MKAQATYDYVCMGFEQSDADSFKGWAVKSVIGGLYIKGKLERVTTVSGITHEQRAEFFRHPKRYIGRVFEAEGKALFSNGALRHPNFLRWRSDKPATACKRPRRR
jgi:ATP-dependent DNA ligase